MTYSIVARDPKTGDLGFASQSHFFGVGRLVGWSKPGVGVVATQALVNLDFGPESLDLMSKDQDPRDIAAHLSKTDPHIEYRQFAMIDHLGRKSYRTGSSCVPFSGAIAVENAVVQGNMLRSRAVVESMAAGFEGSTGSLADRLLAALRSAEDAGGDARGSQSAVLRVVSGLPSDKPWQETRVDIRVDDHADPVTEIERLLPLHRAFDVIGSVIFTPGLMLGPYAHVSDHQLEVALRELEIAAATLGSNSEALFWRGVLLARAGRIDDSKVVLDQVFRDSPQLRSFLTSVKEAGLVNDDTTTI